MSLKFLLFTLLNYIIGLSLLKLIYNLKGTNEGLFFFPFVWFGIFVISIKYFIPKENFKGVINEKTLIKKAIPNIILLLINSLFPIIAFYYLGSIK